MKQSQITLILRVVALAMGIATIVLGILKVSTPETSLTLLGFGLTALALASLQ